MSDRRTLTMLAVAAAVLWHLLSIADHWREAQRIQGGNDFASYYYALQVAWDGGDPYDKASLSASARDDETRKGVHPFFYPPPYLLGMVWARGMELNTAYRLWFWLDVAMAGACALVLWWTWSGVGRAAAPVLLGSVALLTAIPNNHIMGQANFPVLLLVLLALAFEARGRDGVAGALMGAACMAKMSPALFVAWWLLRGRYRPAFVACGAAVVYTLLSLPLVGAAVQWRFYTEVLPSFGSGSYNGLGVGIDLFGNHSLPNLYDDWFPAGGPGHLVLSGTARTLSTITLFGGVAATGWAFRAAPVDAAARHAQIAAIAALMLLVPVITYEHHLIWLAPAAMVAVTAVDEGRLSKAWALPVGLALAAWCYDLVPLKAMWTALKPGWPLTAYLVRELKLLAILTLFAACVADGRRRA